MSKYVVSDIHGLKDRYDAMIQGLNLQEDDTLYILGDVVDRGPDGIVILQDIMKRKNVVMLLGNHEYMMKQYYDAQRGKIDDQEEVYIIQDRWYRNHCGPTINEFEKLSLEEQNNILSFLDTLPLAICDLKVGDNMYYLSHGSISKEFTSGIVYQNDVLGRNVTIEDFVWNRMVIGESVFDDRCIIVGHTPTLFYQDTKPYAVCANTGDVKTASIIDIDCGCAANNQDTRLGVVCLANRTCMYF